MASLALANRALGLRINTDIWNRGEVEKIPVYFAEDFVADRTPYGVMRGHEALKESVQSSHATFEGFKEEVKSITADEERIVVHFTIRGRQVGQWGPVPPTGKEVAFDEIVIMTVRDGKVCHLVGVIDTLTGLRQIGFIPPLPAQPV